MARMASFSTPSPSAKRTLHDSKPDKLDNLRAELESPTLIQAMNDIGYFPAQNSPDQGFTRPSR
jgi:hypothetical protein